MVKRILTIGVGIVIFSVLLFGGFVGTAYGTSADGKPGCGNATKGDTFYTEGQDCFGVEAVAKSANLTTDVTTLTKKDPIVTASNALGIALSFLGVIFFMLVLYAGVTWMLAMGSPEKVEKAKSTLEAAIIGLVIVLGAYAIVAFVFNNIIGVTVGNSSGGNTSGGECTRTKGDNCCQADAIVCPKGIIGSETKEDCITLGGTTKDALPNDGGPADIDCAKSGSVCCYAK